MPLSFQKFLSSTVIAAACKNNRAVVEKPLGRWCHVPEHPMAKKNVLEWKIGQKEARESLKQRGVDPFMQKKEEEYDEKYMIPYVMGS